MRCPKCGFTDSKVIDSRPAESESSIRRRRQCLKCGFRFSTYERLCESQLLVLKADGSSEPFNRDKLYRGLLIACAKRKISADDISGLIDSIEQELRNNLVSEVRSKDIGEMVLKRLVRIDEVAYVRFASVYKDFKSVDEFQSALAELRS